MNNFFLKFKLKNVQKICISGLFIAILVILNKVIAINYIPVIPFVRLTLGAGAIALIASLILGPIYGGFVCAFADVLGYLIFDPKNNAFFPTITLIYLLLGVLPYFLFCFVKAIKNKALMIGIEYSLFVAIFVFISCFLFINPTFTLYGTTYSFEIYQIIIILGILLALFVITIIVNIILDKKVKSKSNLFNVYQVSFVTFLTELIVFVVFGSLMKTIAFGFMMFVPILLTQSVIMFINVPLNTYLILIILRISSKFILVEETNMELENKPSSPENEDLDFKERPTEDLEIDESLLDEEEKPHFELPLTAIILIGVLSLIVIGLTVTLLII